MGCGDELEGAAEVARTDHLNKLPWPAEAGITISAFFFSSCQPARITIASKPKCTDLILGPVRQIRNG
jgi:hypothetical protein